jgi:TonB family protein
MSSSVTQLTQGSLHIGVGQPSGARDPEAWKKLMGQKPVSARLSTLPETKVSRSALLSSSLFQLALAAFIVALPLFFPQKLVTQVMQEVTPLMAPETAVPVPPKPPAVRPKIQPTPPPPVEEVQPVRVARIIAPKPLAAPRPKPVEIKTPDAPQFDQPVLEAKFEAPPSPEPARPREPVKTGLITTGSAAPATVSKPLDKVQTGGFGDPDGLPGKGDPNKRANIASQGSPLLPAGPGYGNGTGGANGVRGTVASAGFGNGVAIPPPGGSGGGSRGTVKSGGFSNAAPATDVPKAKQVDAPAAVQSVVIISKPNPVYTEEARKLGLEGDVLVEVVFPASGPVQVIRVVKGLGHGLDEAAVRAAQQIRFKPALQNGNPVDFSANVRITFQLAF